VRVCWTFLFRREATAPCDVYLKCAAYKFTYLLTYLRLKSFETLRLCGRGPVIGLEVSPYHVPYMYHIFPYVTMSNLVAVCFASGAVVSALYCHVKVLCSSPGQREIHIENPVSAARTVH